MSLCAHIIVCVDIIQAYFSGAVSLFAISTLSCHYDLVLVYLYGCCGLFSFTV